MCCLSFSGVFAQETDKVKYDAHVLFHPLFNFQPGNEYRTGSGAPGPRYWQNRADYKINVALEEEKGIISGDVEITYKNNSPENQEFIWLQLDQNAFNDKSRGENNPCNRRTFWKYRLQWGRLSEVSDGTARQRQVCEC